MHLELTAAQRELRAELRDYFTGLVSPAERRTMLHSQALPAYMRGEQCLGMAGRRHVD